MRAATPYLNPSPDDMSSPCSLWGSELRTCVGLGIEGALPVYTTLERTLPIPHPHPQRDLLGLAHSRSFDPALLMAAAVALNLPALNDGASCLAEPAAASFKFESIDNYEMVEEIGEGTFGIVAKARDRRTGETLAVKCVRGSEGSKPHFLREAGCLAACRGHPNIVDLRGLAVDDATGDLFLVMEFAGPTTLRRHLTTRAGPLTEAEIRASIRQLLAAAERMHAAGIVHRDIKPDNILVSGFGSDLKLCDFGSATAARPLGKAYTERRVGTEKYNVPEQLMGI
ncbi:hypothetical protein HU200_038865 [Digitaria exilis]|uniref:[RNA-polymerase]-subunit kinase n=1 Tax=Digitaria exilis TaxID=1010633 RepID=A0A835EIT1_9POAL|nr:hypothetical protein HU200_038865 [Digitaria exilis]